MYSFEGIENLWHGNTGPRVAGAWRAGQESSLFKVRVYGSDRP